MMMIRTVSLVVLLSRIFRNWNTIYKGKNSIMLRWTHKRKGETWRRITKPVYNANEIMCGEILLPQWWICGQTAYGCIRQVLEVKPTSCECICVLQVSEFDICFYASTEIASIFEFNVGCVSDDLVSGYVHCSCTSVRWMCFWGLSIYILIWGTFCRFIWM